MMIRWISVGVLGLLGMLWLAAEPSWAIPAFSRKQALSCSACHDPFPRLNHYGKATAANAFVPPDREIPPRYFSDVGDERLSLLGELPLAVRADFLFEVRTDEQKGDGFSDFKSPWGLKLLSGGRIADHIGYYLYFFMNERGEVSGIQDAYICFDHLFGSPLDILIGQFQASAPLFKRQIRLTFQDYSVYQATPGKSQSNLTYDRGIMLTWSFDFGLDLAGIVTNGNGKSAADLQQDFDFDRYKNFMLRLSQRFGPVRVGVFGYYGKEERMEDRSIRTNELNIWGPDLTLSLGRAQLNLQYLQRRDLNPNFAPSNPLTTFTHGFLMEAVADLLKPSGRLYLILLFNYIDSELLDLDQQAYTVNLTHLLRTNIKILGEYTFARIVNGAERNEHRLTLGIVAGF